MIENSQVPPQVLMTATADCDIVQGFSQHERWLRTTVHSRLGNLDEVDEVMQEVALAVANQASRQESVERVGAWLYRVALRQVMLLRRKAGRRRKLIQSVQRQHREPSAPGPLDFLLGSERQEAVRTAMGRLPELDRQLLMFKYVDGLSYSEIAQRIGATASAVQSRLHRARALLRQSLSFSDSELNDEPSKFKS